MELTSPNPVEAGDHYLYICDVSHIYADAVKTQIFAWNGYADIQPLSA